MARLRFSITINGMDEEHFVVRQFQGIESISTETTHWGTNVVGYRYEIDLASRQHDLSAEHFVDQNVRLELHRNGQLERVIHGVVRAFTKGDTGHHHTFYSLVLVPSIERLALRHNSRIFQKQTVPEIISILLQEMGINDYAFSLQNEIKPRDYCVQYRETDLDFIHRLMAEEGIVYSFLHGVNTHQTIFSDSVIGLSKLESSIPYNPQSGGHARYSSISSMIETKCAETDYVELSDHHFTNPELRHSNYALAIETHLKPVETYEHFDFPGRYDDEGRGKVLSETRLGSLRRYAHTAIAQSDYMEFHAGLRFSIEQDLNTRTTLDWQVVALKANGSQPQALEEEGNSGATTFHSELFLIPETSSLKLPQHKKPIVDGKSIATVVGPQNEEIYCDEYGRVKLHFPWDRYSNADEHSSCWVRVSHDWAGSQYGTMMLPRVGQEVIVSFINGDPDYPIVTGRTYNALNTHPYEFPQNKTKTVIRTSSYQGSGFNEFSFEDQSGREQIYLHAQNNLKAEVKNDLTEHVRHDRHKLVENNTFSKVMSNLHQTVGGESRAHIHGEMTEVSDSSVHQQTSAFYGAEAGREISLKSGAKIVVEAGAEITLKAGGSFVKVDGSGVHLVGPAISLNGGGSAGVGSSYSGQLALLPNSVEPTKAPVVSTFIRYPALEHAETANVPLVKPCPLEGET